MNYYAKVSHIAERNQEVYSQYKGKLKEDIDRKSQEIIKRYSETANRENSDMFNNLFQRFFNQNRSEMEVYTVSDAL